MDTTTTRSPNAARKDRDGRVCKANSSAELQKERDTRKIITREVQSNTAEAALKTGPTYLSNLARLAGGRSRQLVRAVGRQEKHS